VLITMAFKNGLSERLDELRFTSPRSPPSDSPFSGYTSPPRGQPNFMTAFQQPASNDVRANLQRRFTTDSSKLSWPPFSQQTTQLPDGPDLLSSVSRALICIECYIRILRRHTVSICSFRLPIFTPCHCPITPYSPLNH
jgi:hypothetical protein